MLRMVECGVTKMEHQGTSQAHRAPYHGRECTALEALSTRGGAGTEEVAGAEPGGDPTAAAHCVLRCRSTALEDEEVH